MAWREMIRRDADRFKRRKKAAQCSAAWGRRACRNRLSHRSSKNGRTLGFDGIAQNSLDAVSDRDFAIEFCHAASLLMMHLSRWSEELVLWSSPLLGFIDLPDRFVLAHPLCRRRKTGRAGTCPRQNWASLWCADQLTDAHEEPTTRLQQRQSGRQRTAL